MMSGGDERIRLFVVGGHRQFRRNVRILGSQTPGILILGEADSIREALESSPGKPVDVVVLELTSPVDPEVLAARGFHQKPWESGLIVMPPQEDSTLLFIAISLGAAAFVPQDTPPEYLVSVIHRVFDGEYPIQYNLLSNPAVAGYLLQHFREASPAAPTAIPAPLSQRDTQILTLVASGCTNKEIADRLGISEQTVKNYITAILRKIQANDRAHAAVMAVRRGWIQVT